MIELELKINKTNSLFKKSFELDQIRGTNKDVLNYSSIIYYQGATKQIISQYINNKSRFYISYNLYSFLFAQGCIYDNMQPFIHINNLLQNIFEIDQYKNREQNNILLKVFNYVIDKISVNILSYLNKQIYLDGFDQEIQKDIDIIRTLNSIYKYAFTELSFKIKDFGELTIINNDKQFCNINCNKKNIPLYMHLYPFSDNTYISTKEFRRFLPNKENKTITGIIDENGKIVFNIPKITPNYFSDIFSYIYPRPYYAKDDCEETQQQIISHVTDMIFWKNYIIGGLPILAYEKTCSEIDNTKKFIHKKYAEWVNLFQQKKITSSN